MGEKPYNQLSIEEAVGRAPLTLETVHGLNAQMEAQAAGQQQLARSGFPQYMLLGVLPDMGLTSGINGGIMEQQDRKQVEKLVLNSQKNLLDAGMDLNGDNKVTFAEFAGVLKYHGKTMVNAIMADADSSQSFSPKEIQGLTKDKSNGRT
jgi:hypothetical protein